MLGRQICLLRGAGCGGEGGLCGCMERRSGEEVLNFKHVEFEMPLKHPKS